MDIEIKKAVRAGNSSAVILPRAWLDKEVRVELIKKSPETILQDTLNIAGKHINPKEIIGIYLAGSYARGEEDKGSDIDLLVISANTDIEMIHEGVYNILIVSEGLLRWKLENDLLPIGPMLLEAKPLINMSYLDSVRVKVTRKNVRWYIETAGEKLKLIEEALKSLGKKVDGRVVYTLILRIRTLHLIQKMIKGEGYSKRDFVSLIKRVSGSGKAYEAYLGVKNDAGDAEDGRTTKEEAEKLYDYLRGQLARVQDLLG